MISGQHKKYSILFIRNHGIVDSYNTYLLAGAGWTGLLALLWLVDARTPKQRRNVSRVSRQLPLCARGRESPVIAERARADASSTAKRPSGQAQPNPSRRRRLDASSVAGVARRSQGRLVTRESQAGTERQAEPDRTAEVPAKRTT